MRVVLSKDKAKAANALRCLIAKTTKEKNKDIDELNEEIQLIDEIRKELKIKEEFTMLYRDNKALFVKPKFYRRYYAKFLNIESDIEKDEAEIGETTNQYYAPEFAEYFTVEFMTYIPICGALMLDLVDPSISRVSNVFVESFNKVLKHNVL